MTRYVHVNVYTPNLPRRWSPYRTRLLLAPLVWLAWLLRGLRFRIGRPQLGRKVTLPDMQPYHRGRASKCACRGEGIIATWRGEERGFQFCAQMLGPFKEHARAVTYDTKHGPRWLAGFEPERLAR